MIGVRAFWRQRLWQHGREILAFQPCDTATHPDFRRQGVFSKLTMAAIDEAIRQNGAVLYNFPNPMSKPGYAKLGWQDVGGMFAMVKVLRPISVARQVLKSRRHIPPFVVDPKGSRIEAGSIAIDAGSIAYLKETERLCGDRTNQYLAWRLSEHPRIAYNVLNLDAGVAITRSGRRGLMREVSIVDIMSPDEKRRPRLVRELVERLRCEHQADIISVVISSGHEFASIFRRAGFVPFGGRVNFVAKSLRPDIELGGLQWRLAGCDIDTF